MAELRWFGPRTVYVVTVQHEETLGIFSTERKAADALTRWMKKYPGDHGCWWKHWRVDKEQRL